MSYAPSSVYSDVGDGSIIGCFVEKQAGNYFEYSSNDDGPEEFAEYPHKIWVTTPWKMDHGFRYGIVKKTVAYLCVDEDEYGLPVVERWAIKQRVEYEG